MLSFLKTIVSRAISLKNKFPLPRRFNIRNNLAMACEGSKNKRDLKMEHKPIKKIKLDSDNVMHQLVETRTVATMCGAWRPEEEYGGLIFVFKTREACLSPDPTNEADYPENIQDFWGGNISSQQ